MLTHEERQAIRERAKKAPLVVLVRKEIFGLLDYIDELESMPLVQTVVEQKKEIERLHQLWFLATSAESKYVQELARQALEGESHANL